MANVHGGKGRCATMHVHIQLTTGICSSLSKALAVPASPHTSKYLGAMERIRRTSGLWHSRPTQQEATDQQQGESIGPYTYTLVDDALEPPCRVICTPVNFSHVRPQLSARSNCTFSKQFPLASQGRTTDSRLFAASYQRRRIQGNIDVYHRP